MDSAYPNTSLWKDPPANLPLIGFVVGTALSCFLWVLVGWGAWVLIH